MYEIFEKLLKERGLKAADVSRGTGLSSTFFTEWKKGKSKNPNPTNLQKVADFFGVSLDYLMTGKEPALDYLYTDENADFLVEVTRMSKDKEFVARIKKYMTLLSEDKKSVDDMIDFMYNKEHKGED